MELNRSVHRFVRLANLLQDDIKFIVVAIVSSAVSWTMVNRNNIIYEFIVNNQRWAGDRLAGFVKAVLRECCVP